MSILFKKKNLNKQVKIQLSKTECLEDLQKALNSGKETNTKYLSSLECLSVEKLNLLKTLLTQQNIKISKNTFKHAKSCLEIINYFVESKNYSGFIENDCIFRPMIYQLPQTNRIGEFSATHKGLRQIPEHFSSFLFEGLYYHVEIVNDNLAILFNFSKIHNVPCTILESAITDKKAFYSKIISKNPQKDIERILKQSSYKGSSPILRELFLEVKNIRSHIWLEFYESNKLNQTDLNENGEFLKLNQDKKLVTVQQLFCQTMKTTYLLQLYEYLEAQKENLDFGYFTDDFLKINLRERVHFIPYLNGVLLRYYDDLLHLNIPKIIDEFNKNTSNCSILFEIKPFTETFTKQEFDFIKDYQVFRNVISKIRRNQLSALLNKLQIEFKLSSTVLEQIKQDALELSEQLNKNQIELSILYEKKDSNDAAKISALRQKRKSLYYYHLTDDQFDVIRTAYLKMELKVFQRVQHNCSTSDSLRKHLKDDLQIYCKNEFDTMDFAQDNSFDGDSFEEDLENNSDENSFE